ncbi:MAG: lycopene cyclase [Actinobacteria bacterium BACL4 MAG-120820-bin23]|uniref:lycopene cyclase domain-containing protein n=1 Tax=Candidatus Nanopelagicus sp. TaxID=2518620 RepID=UPI0007137595|nr:MAG: lycopene cyclase [Actinobacteria bacterium BACL4 MAG-121022-bin9]KRO50361.1 MAG: lycopene cyclase [Actinobacteria bacterium BACL4 MAG-120820-bin23]KRO51641.1 MAG: lycopene cyclase [Actinobacteria bacterium BACL4 MAG-121001-bin59]KRO77246.1 MAG: lycopene cyclase [Actinobacteria bacterium BACL4 MAG-120920-bin74]KRO92931.1 MAG: lycopene cyclase [Actinobacteria bacterium BACL4 MAG-120507-bin0]HCP72678.1 lycopene cyclase domain-containing protein [Actinomycetota bacterium]
MVYTDIAIVAFIASIIADRFLIKSKLLTRKVFWTSYAIILFFQLLTNWWLTSRNIVMYNPEAIIGLRIASAPVEDLFFGFALVLLVMNLWVFWGKRGIQKK